MQRAGHLARQRTVRWREMNETCDRCGPAIRAAYRVNRVGELYLCGHCASRQWRALSAQGWTFWPLGVPALGPQAGYGPPADAACGAPRGAAAAPEAGWRAG